MKKVLLFLIALMGLFSLGACKKDGVSSGKIRIDYWHMSPVGSPSYSATKQIINKYNESQDKYEVKGTGFGFWDYWDKINIAISSKTAPDVGLSTLDDVVARASAGALYNISELARNDTSEINIIDFDQFRESQKLFATYNGDLYAMPFSGTTRALYYNLDMFAEKGLTKADVPTTWSELKTVAEKFDKVKNNQIERIGFDPTYGNATYHGWLWQTGLDFFDENLIPTLNTSKHVEVLDWIVNFNSQFTRAQLQAFGEGNQMLGINPFAAERVAMIVEVDGLYQQIKDANATFEYGVAPIPVPDENGIRVNWGSGFSIELYKNGAGNISKRDGAYDFLKYMMSYQTQLDIANANGWIMSHIQAMDDFTKDDPILAALYQELDYAVDKVYVPYAPSWHGNDWQPFYNQALEKTLTPQEALNRARLYYLEKKSNYEQTNK